MNPRSSQIFMIIKQLKTLITTKLLGSLWLRFYHKKKILKGILFMITDSRL